MNSEQMAFTFGITNLNGIINYRQIQSHGRRNVDHQKVKLPD